MAILPILRWPDPRLSAICAPAVSDEITLRLAQDMLETMYAAPGRGLAAPQVGALIRLFVMDETWKTGQPNPRILLNPEILWSSPQRVTGPEGCLSIPGVTAQVERGAEIELRWTAPDGTPRQERMAGFSAICAQHELDHLDGLVTFDRLSPGARAQAEAEFAA